MKDNPFPSERTSVKDNVRCGAFIISGMGTLVSFFCSIGTGLAVFNAEYYAFKNLIEIISRIK
jgi:hypothetical protein